jgi:hypothetical protein
VCLQATLKQLIFNAARGLIIYYNGAQAKKIVFASLPAHCGVSGAREFGPQPARRAGRACCICTELAHRVPRR